MITKEQLDRLEREQIAKAANCFRAAGAAERELENYTYNVRPYDPAHRQKLLDEFNEADYQAECNAYILNLVVAAKNAMANTKGV